MSRNFTSSRNDPWGSGAGSFLPEDYLLRKRERRTNIFSLVLFAVVMSGVVGAFFVTNRQWSTVKATQEQINRDYTAEAKKIEQLKVLESQKAEMLEKAEITAALIERVPRSILLAEVINRMPPELTLTDLKLTGKRIKEAPAPSAAKKTADRKPKSISASAAKTAAAAKPETEEAKPKPAAPKFDFTVELVGLATTDQRVADYHAALKQCPLLSQVDLNYTGEVMIDEVGRRKFRIEATIRPNADARKIEPLRLPRGFAQLGPDGKPLPASAQPEAWLSRLGLTPAKPGIGPLGEEPSTPEEPATADASNENKE